MASSTRDLLNAGNTTINNVLLTNIGHLNMTGDEFLVWVNLRMYQEQGIQFPATDDLVLNTGFSAEKIYQLIQNLIDKKMLKIVSQTKANSVYQDAYDLTPAYEQLLKQAVGTDEKASQQTHLSQSLQVRQRLFQQIEVEFGRPLSPIEQETIQEWLTKDHYDYQLIQLALKEAVLNQAYSLKYMDRILLNWEKHNIKTAAQLQRQKENLEGY